MALYVPLKGVSYHAYEQICRKGAPAISLRTLNRKIRRGRAKSKEALGGRRAVLYEGYVYILGLCRSEGVVSVLTTEEYKNQKNQGDSPDF